MSFAQSKINSPLSRFGFGDLIDQDFTASSSMGGLSGVYYNPYTVNLENPATLSFLKSTSFEVGLYAQRSKYSFLESSSKSWTGNLRHISLAFPLKNPIDQIFEKRPSDWQYGMGISLVPYSVVGYDMFEITSDPNLGEIEEKYVGNGATYTLQWSGSARYKNLSVGLNLGYLFGKVEDDRISIFNDLVWSFANVNRKDYDVDAFVWKAGLLYRYDIPSSIKEDKPATKSITFGLSGRATQSFTTDGNSYVLRGRNFIINDFVSLDTIFSQENIDGNGTLPAEFNLGIMYEELNKLKLGLNFQSSFWSKYENEIDPDQLENSWRLSIGGEYTPEYNSYKYYYKRMSYRFGLIYGNDPRVVLGDQLGRYGLTAGFTLPVILPQQQVSFVNFGIELGRISNDQISENYVKMNIGFTFNNNRWFLQRKFN